MLAPARAIALAIGAAVIGLPIHQLPGVDRLVRLTRTVVRITSVAVTVVVHLALALCVEPAIHGDKTLAATGSTKLLPATPLSYVNPVYAFPAARQASLVAAAARAIAA